MSVLRAARTRHNLQHVADDRRGSAVAHYFVFATLWCAGIAAAVQFAAPHVTTRLGTAATMMQSGPIAQF